MNAGRKEIEKMKSLETKEHKFEARGLGKAPFVCVGSEYKVVTIGVIPPVIVKPGATCDYCGTAISNVFNIRSADNKRFHVGSECVNKTGDAGLIRKVNAEAKKIKDAKLNSAFEKLFANSSAIEQLALTPHPKGWEGKTFLDYADWMYNNAGAAGRTKLLKEINSVLKAI